MKRIKEEVRKKFYTLNNDRVFKSIVEEKPELLSKILSDVLEEEVEVVKFMPTELRIKKTRSKVNTLDIIVRSKDKRVINVELNSNYDKITKERNLGYYTSIFSQNILRGEEKISETIQVNLNFNGSKKGKGKEVYYIKER